MIELPNEIIGRLLALEDRLQKTSESSTSLPPALKVLTERITKLSDRIDALEKAAPETQCIEIKGSATEPFYARSSKTSVFHLCGGGGRGPPRIAPRTSGRQCAAGDLVVEYGNAGPPYLKHKQACCARSAYWRRFGTAFPESARKREVISVRPP